MAWYSFCQSREGAVPDVVPATVSYYAASRRLQTFNKLIVLHNVNELFGLIADAKVTIKLQTSKFLGNFFVTIAHF